MIGKRIALQQSQNGRRAFAQALEEEDEPDVVARIGAEKWDPHLPVEPRHHRRGELGAAAEGAGLPFEFVGLPGHAVVAPLDDQLRAVGGHNGEQAVAAGNSKWQNESGQIGDRSGQRDVDVERVDADRN